MPEVYRRPDEQTGLDLFRSARTNDSLTDVDSLALDSRSNAALMRIRARWLASMVKYEISGPKVDSYLESATLAAYRRQVKSQGARRLPTAIIPLRVSSKVSEQVDFLETSALNLDQNADIYSDGAH